MGAILKISAQTFWQILGKFVSSLSTIVILGLVARNYGEVGIGIFTLALTYLAFFYLAADFGINAHFLTRVHGMGYRKQVEWRKLLGLRIVWAFLLVLISLLITPLLPFNNQTFSRTVLFGSLAIMGYALFISANAIFQSRLRYDLSVLATTFGTVVALLTITFVVFKDLPVPYLAIGYMVGWIVTGLLALILVKKFLNNLSPEFSLNYLKTTLGSVWPISLTLVLNVVYFRVDSFILTSYKSFAEVGIYNLAYQIFQSALVLPTFIMNAYYPIMLTQYNQSKNLLKLSIAKGCLVLGTLGLVGTLVTLLLSPFFIALLTAGQGFSGSVNSLKALSLGFPAYFISALLMWSMVVLKRYKQMLAIYLIGLLANITLNLILVPKYSYMASSFITGISEYLILILQLIILLKVWRK